MSRNSPYQLGPWNINQSLSYAHNSVLSSPKKKPSDKIQYLPKIANLSVYKELTIKPRQKAMRQNESFRVTPCELSLSSRFKSFSIDKKQRISAYDPPLISFYNKNHPKLKKRSEQMKTNRSNGFNQNQLHFRSIQIKSLSRIDLMDGYLRSSQGYSLLYDQKQEKKEKLLSSKRSLTELLKYLTNSNQKSTKINPQKNEQQFLRYTEIQQNLIKYYLGKQEKLQKEGKHE